MLKQLNFKEFFRTMSLLGRMKPAYIISLTFFSLAFPVVQILVGFVYKTLFNSVEASRGVVLSKGLIAMVTVFLAACLTDPVSGYFYQLSIKKATLGIRGRFLAQVVKLPISYFDSTHSGDLFSRLTNDIDVTENAFRLNDIVMCILYGAGSAISMFIIDWRLSFITVAMGLLQLLLDARLSKHMRRLSDSIQAAAGTLTGQLLDIVSGIRVIKLFNLHSHILAGFSADADRMAQASLQRAANQSKMDSLNYLISGSNVVIILVFGMFFIRAGLSDLGSVMAIIVLQTGLANMFLQLGGFISNIQGALAGSGRIFEVLDTPVERQYEQAGGPKADDLSYVVKADSVSPDSTMISFNKVSFYYREREKTLDNIDINVGKGQTAALVGESGSGKSTVLKLLMKFYDIQDGIIKLDNISINDLKLQDLRNKIAYVSQDTYLFDGTIKENIRYGNINASDEEVTQAAKDAYAHEFIAGFEKGYETEIGERGCKLSGGQRQRIAIARAFLKDAPLLLLDEATSALDSESEEYVQKALNALTASRTVLVVAHRLSTVEHADVIYVFNEGKIVEVGTHTGLLEQNGLYSRFYRLQSGSGD